MFIYFHRNPKTYEIFYVGMCTHLGRSRDFTLKARSEQWKEYVTECGKPVVQIVQKNLSFDMAEKWEMFYIELLGRKIKGGQLVNKECGGNKAESLKDYWIKHPERNPCFKPENIKRLKENHPMRRPEIALKVSLSKIGKKRSPETIEKMRKSKIGWHNSFNSKPVIQIDIETGETINTFISLTHALRHVGKSERNHYMAQVCEGKREIAFGYKWKYA